MNFAYDSIFFNFYSSVRRAFDLVADQTVNGKITIVQCQVALPLLGYAQNLLSTDTLVGIIESHRESDPDATSSCSSSSAHPVKMKSGDISITFDEFCVMTSYLAILQQEIHESGCVSPLKGTNLPPPPIFLTNTPGTSLNLRFRSGQYSKFLSFRMDPSS